jgi:hypothetical protein
MTTQASPHYDIDPEGCYLFVRRATRKEILGVDPVPWTLHLLGRRSPRCRNEDAPEFRRQMVELVRSGRNPEELSREFEPSKGSNS